MEAHRRRRAIAAADARVQPPFGEPLERTAGPSVTSSDCLRNEGQRALRAPPQTSDSGSHGAGASRPR